MPEEARKEAQRELNRFKNMSPHSPEYSVIKTYLDWILELPWKKLSEDQTDIRHARAILDEDHYDLAEVKDRIIEYLAVRKLIMERGLTVKSAGEEAVAEAMGVILCFSGPPGVGKTSLGKSIARALGRKFTRMSLGGMRDEAEIRGHRRTYIGAMPGRIIQGIKRTGTRNPVFMLDEVDKIGADWRGDPSSALLEVLDPAQNHAFRDYYLDVDFDLSDVIFITTANQLETIPRPLRDRMEIIQLDGYTEYEKIQIAQRHLVPRQVKANGLNEDEITFTEDALRKIVRDYTREAGVRNLERQVGAVCRKSAVKIAGGEWLACGHYPGAGAQPAEAGKIRVRVAGRYGNSGNCNRPGRHRSRRRYHLYRGHPHAGYGQAESDRPTGRSDAGKCPDRPQLRPLQGRSAGHRSGPVRKDATCTCTCRRERFPKTGLRPELPWSWPSPAFLPAGRSAATWA